MTGAYAVGQGRSRVLLWLSAISAALAVSLLNVTRGYPWLLCIGALLLYGAAMLLPVIPAWRAPTFRLKVCAYGYGMLTAFLLSLVPALAVQILRYAVLLPADRPRYFVGVLIFVLAEALLFGVGVVCLYLTSVQLGIGLRVIGVLCGLIPVVNLFVLFHLLRVVKEEVVLESEKVLLNFERRDRLICRTRYPILLVHGFLFRDRPGFDAWGRIPDELTRNGATVLYGKQQSCISVPESAAELAARIRKILDETGCEKLNVIAHSKGGLDIRYAMAYEGIAPYIASVTTINSPHRGCVFAEHLLQQVPVAAQKRIAAACNAATKNLGDHAPDFLATVNDLTAGVCRGRDGEIPCPEGVFCQSYGSRLVTAEQGKFPFNLIHDYVKRYDGVNDGVVAEESFAWGERYTLLEPTGKRGISHVDMIDLYRENIPDFDVREFYVEVVHDLKKRGL